MEFRPDKVLDSKTADTVAKRLWPSMLFLVVMSIITLVGGRWWSFSMENQVSIHISYWLWFLGMLTVTGFGVYVFVLDARIQINASKQAS